MTALPARPLGTPGLALPAPEWPGTHDDARGSVPPSGSALVTCRRRVVGGLRCGIALKPGWIRGYLAHTVKPASPHYPRPFSVREVVESHMPEDHDPETWRAFWGVES
jgi:hypothetical protein